MQEREAEKERGENLGKNERRMRETLKESTMSVRKRKKKRKERCTAQPSPQRKRAQDLLLDSDAERELSPRNSTHADPYPKARHSRSRMTYDGATEAMSRYGAAVQKKKDRAAAWERWDDDTEPPCADEAEAGVTLVD